MKKNWSTPGLVILLRGRPEEKVLEICKVNNPNVTSIGPSIQFNIKCADLNASQNCASCQGEGGHAS